MKKISIILSLFLALLMVAGIFGCAAPAPTPTPAPTHEKVIVDLRTHKFGTQSYIIGTCIEELSREHPWLAVSNTESPGATWAIEHMAATPEAWPNTVATCSAFLVQQAIEGKGKFAEKPLPQMKDYRALWSNSVLLIHFMTFDPDIKTVKDLEGKRVGMGSKGAGAWGQIPTVMFETLGIKPKLEYLGNSPSQKALVEGKVDAAICLTYTNAEIKAMIPNVVYTETVAVPGKEVLIVHWGEAETKKLLDELGTMVTAFEIPPNSGAWENQPETMWLMASAGGWGVWNTFPEDVAYEMVMMWAANYTKFVERHAQMQVVSLETMAKGYPKEIYHPGALKAYEELGVKY